MGLSKSEQLVESLNFCVIDLETTGGNPTVDQIIEIGLVKIAGRKIKESKNFLINPGVQIPEFIQKLTSIKQSDIIDCPKIEDVIDEIIEFVGSDIIVAHNTSFDVPFLNGILQKIGKTPFPNRVLCTNVMTKYLIPEIMNSNLNYMSQLFNIEHLKAHRAIEDATATAYLLIKYLDIFIEKNIRKINQLYYPRNKFELDRLHIEQGTSEEEILGILKSTRAPVVLTFKGEQGVLQATLPLKQAAEELDIVKLMLKKIDWNILTIKLVGPFFEGLLQLNAHYSKLPEENKKLILNYLYKQYNINDKKYNKNEMEQIDFMMAPHLITNQLTVYSFFNLNTKNQLIFKFPGHKKKFLQYMRNQISRFEKNAKGRKRSNIIPQLVPLLSTYINEIKESSRYLFISRAAFKENPQEQLNKIDSFLMKNMNCYDFPMSHL